MKFIIIPFLPKTPRPKTECNVFKRSESTIKENNIFVKNSVGLSTADIRSST